MDFRFGCKSGRAADIAATAEFGPEADIIGAVPPAQFGLN